jgi:hypothetical protein
MTAERPDPRGESDAKTGFATVGVRLLPLTRRQRRELGAVALFVIVSVAMPFVRHELFPFSTFRLFPDSIQRYTEYRITSPEGAVLRLSDFGLHRNYWGYPLGQGYGILEPPSVDQWRVVESRDIVVEQVSRALSSFPALDYVTGT